MSNKTQTPYGGFVSQSEAARFIARYYGVEFILNFPYYEEEYPYDKSKDHYNKGMNNATINYVYWVMREHLLDKVTGWARLP